MASPSTIAILAESDPAFFVMHSSIKKPFFMILSLRSRGLLTDWVKYYGLSAQSLRSGRQVGRPKHYHPKSTLKCIYPISIFRLFPK